MEEILRMLKKHSTSLCIFIQLESTEDTDFEIRSLYMSSLHILIDRYMQNMGKICMLGKRIPTTVFFMFNKSL